jgi:hypothetical protein
MTEFLLLYETAPDVPRQTAKAMMDKMFRRDLSKRGLSEEQVVREVIFDGAPTNYEGSQAGWLRYRDRVVVLD